MKNHEADATWAKQALRDAALRATAARVAVMKLLASAETPMSHGEVVEALAEFGFDQSTLFRCLNELADAGLVSRLDLGDQTRRFELRRTSGEAELTHPHFMCVDCGEFTCLKDFSVQISPSRGPRRDKLGTITEIMIRGHCGNCQTE
ncbi:MAG: transcriptional repressor [Pirellulales bacterium]